MVRHTLALRGMARSSDEEISVEERVVNIFKKEQLEEYFLCEVNGKGQVPVLASADKASAPIADSMTITEFIAERYPELLPSAYKARLLVYMKRLHAINFFSLSFSGRKESVQTMQQEIEKLMSETTSQRYLDALRYKANINKAEKVDGLSPKAVERAILQTVTLLRELAQFCDFDKCPWIFGLPKPSALDAHLVVFLARLEDVGRDNLIPAPLKAYLQFGRGQKGFLISTVNGKTTIELPSGPTHYSERA